MIAQFWRGAPPEGQGHLQKARAERNASRLSEISRVLKQQDSHMSQRVDVSKSKMSYERSHSAKDGRQASRRLRPVSACDASYDSEEAKAELRENYDELELVMQMRNSEANMDSLRKSERMSLDLVRLQEAGQN